MGPGSSWTTTVQSWWHSLSGLCRILSEAWRASMAAEPRILYLIDISSYLYRAFHAIRGLATSKGFPTNAAYGVTNMLLKVITERQPHYLALVFDSRGPTQRHRDFPDYKAHRP